MTSAQKLFGPLSHSPGWMPTCASVRLAKPSGSRMIRQIVPTTNAGSTYGMRNTERTRPRPRNACWVASAAAMPIGVVTTVTMTA